jgi:uncharacterized membrane protein YedE/YeeE
MNTSVSLSPSQTRTAHVLLRLLLGAGLLFGFGFYFLDTSRQIQLFAIGLGLGTALYYGSFGFSAAYRAAIMRRDMTGVIAQLVMIGVATVLFAPILSSGQASGAWAPVGLQVAVGAFIFGIGMQLGGACASGTLFSIGGGSLRMMITLVFFCLGAFFGSLHLGWWGQLPDWGTQTFGHLLGWQVAVLFQLTAFALIWVGLCFFGKGYEQTGLWQKELGFRNLLMGPWPLLLSAVVLAGLNFLTLLVAGHPWSVTWAFTLWGAKLVSAAGIDLSFSGFWTAPFQSGALNGSLLADTTSLMNIAVVFGAFIAALVSARWSLKVSLSRKQLLASILGGLLMGYGARLAYGCNIGALFSGMSSTSLHAWLWLFTAIMGTWLGIKIRPLFGLKN